MIKTLEFINSRRPELEIKATFIRQLQEYEQRLNKNGLGPLSFTFNEYSFRGPNGQRPSGIKVSSDLEGEEVILRNTFVNAQTGPMPPRVLLGNSAREQTTLLRWVDEASRAKIPLSKEGP